MCKIFEKILPESVGIPSEAILNFIDALEKRDVNMKAIGKRFIRILNIVCSL